MTCAIEILQTLLQTCPSTLKDIVYVSSPWPRLRTVPRHLDISSLTSSSFPLPNSRDALLWLFHPLVNLPLHFMVSLTTGPTSPGHSAKGTSLHHAAKPGHRHTILFSTVANPGHQLCRSVSVKVWLSREEAKILESSKTIGSQAAHRDRNPFAFARGVFSPSAQVGAAVGTEMPLLARSSLGDVGASDAGVGFVGSIGVRR
jgi:hypothetical protein